MNSPLNVVFTNSPICRARTGEFTLSLEQGLRNLTESNGRTSAPILKSAWQLSQVICVVDWNGAHPVVTDRGWGRYRVRNSLSADTDGTWNSPGKRPRYQGHSLPAIYSLAISMPTTVRVARRRATSQETSFAPNSPQFQSTRWPVTRAGDRSPAYQSSAWVSFSSQWMIGVPRTINITASTNVNRDSPLFLHAEVKFSRASVLSFLLYESYVYSTKRNEEGSPATLHRQQLDGKPITGQLGRIYICPRIL